MRTAIGSIVVLALFMSVGCATAPKTKAEKRSLIAEADATITTMTAKDPSLREVIDRAPGYVIVPDIGTAGAIVGGAYGRGVAYERGRPIGFAELNQASLGAQLGAQSYAQLIVFENEAALNRLKAGNIDFGAEASAVALKAGAGKGASFEGGMAVFQMPRGGLMAAAAINGQKINFEPMDRSITAGDPATTRSGEMELRTERTQERIGEATDNAQSATERTEQRIEQRRDQAEEKAQDAAREPGQR
jgi:lipid-binding SYLF domain-containing protein